MNVKEIIIAMILFLSFCQVVVVAEEVIVKTAYAVNDTQEFINGDVVSKTWYLDGEKVQGVSDNWHKKWNQSEEGFHNVTVVGKYANGTSFTKRWEVLVIDPDQKGWDVYPINKKKVFEASFNKKVDVAWYLNHVLIKNDIDVLQSNLSHSFTETGYQNIIIVVSKNNNISFSGEWEKFYIGTLLFVNNSNITNISVKIKSMIVNNNENFNLTITATNVSDIASPHGESSATINYEVTNSFFDLVAESEQMQQVEIIENAEGKTMMFPFSLKSVGKNGTFLIRMLASAENKSGELPVSTETGQVIVTIPADINGDFVVNIVDLTIFRQAFYGLIDCPRCDINNDGEVNIIDLTILRQSYGDEVITI